MTHNLLKAKDLVEQHNQFKNFVLSMSIMTTPTDGVLTEEGRSDIMADLSDETLCGDANAFYDMIRLARKIIRESK